MLAQIHRKRAKAPLALVLGLLLLTLGATLAALWLRELNSNRPQSGQFGPESQPVDTSGSDQDVVEIPDSERWSGSAVSVLNPIDPNREVRPFDLNQLKGSGRIRGRILLTEGSASSGPWTVQIGPAKALIGAELAEQRSLQLDPESYEFEFNDLPCAGYELTVHSPSHQCKPWQGLLQKGQSELFVQLSAQPLGRIQGSVVDASGQPLADLPVWLEASDKTRRSTQTDPAGGYWFEAVLDGEYELFVGPPDNAFNDPLSLSFRAPNLSLQPIELSQLCSLWIQVLDAQGQPASGASLRGWGSEGGVIDLITDAEGQARAPHLVAGIVKVYAYHDLLGRGNTRIQLKAGENAKTKIELKSP